MLAETDADLLACETIPSADEAAVLIRLLCETPGRWAWISFSCRDGTRLCNGKPIAEAALLCDAVPQVAAVGINCTAPEFVAPLIKEVRQVTEKPVIVYPNSGEQYDSTRRTWAGKAERSDWGELAAEWARLGATGIGGCCRVGPDEVAEIRRQLVH